VRTRQIGADVAAGQVDADDSVPAPAETLGYRGTDTGGGSGHHTRAHRHRLTPSAGSGWTSHPAMISLMAATSSSGRSNMRWCPPSIDRYAKDEPSASLRAMASSHSRSAAETTADRSP